MSRKNKLNRVKLIVNPGAGRASDSAKNLTLVLDSLKKNGLKANVAFAKPKEEATPIARKAIKDGYPIVIAMGGDGTIEAVMRGLAGSKVRMGIIPTGNENNVALSLGISKDLEEACAMIASDNTLKLDLGQVKTRKGKKSVFFEIATVGLSAAIYPDAAKVAKGNLSKITDAVKTFFHQETRPIFSLTLNDESKFEVETMLVMVANTPTFGKKFMVAPNASLQDGLLDISVYPDFSKSELLRYYAAVMNGGYSGDKKVQHYQARKLKIKPSSKLDVMADGVALGRGTTTIKVLPKALRVIAVKQDPQVDDAQKLSSVPLSEPVPEGVEDNHKEESVVTLK